MQGNSVYHQNNYLELLFHIFGQHKISEPIGHNADNVDNIEYNQRVKLNIYIWGANL